MIKERICTSVAKKRQRMFLAREYENVKDSLTIWAENRMMHDPQD